jgi:tripartite-type tricarboxylate transporter receptor subunit TctC
VRPLAVLSEKRVATLPDVPTSKEAGIDNFLMSIWYGLFVPAATPRDIVSRLTGETLKALESPVLRERMAGAGIDPWPGTADEMGKLVRSETARYATIVRSAGLKPE